MRHLLRKPNEDVEIKSTSGLAAAIKLSRGMIDHTLDDPKKHYFEMKIPKKNGKFRIIHAPSRVLKTIQRSLLSFLYQRFRIPGHIHGGIPNRSIFTNAKPHIGKFMVATFDIRDFFPNTTVDHLLPVFHIAGFRGKALDAVVALTTLNDRLVQGSPTSCFLANLGFLEADQKIIKLAKRRGLWMGRFVDDIVLSGQRDFSELKGPIIDRIQSVGFPVAEEKTCFMRRSERQEVTGLIVNEVLRPSRQYISDLKRMVRLCQNEGASLVAADQGIPIGKLRSSLLSKADFLRQSDRKKGVHLKNLLKYSVDWKSSVV